MQKPRITHTSSDRIEKFYAGQLVSYAVIDCFDRVWQYETKEPAIASKEHSERVLKQAASVYEINDEAGTRELIA